jgi:DNA ligase-1
MRTLQHFNNFVKEITSSNSRLHKQAVLQKYKDDEVVKRYLKILLDPFEIYGISTKKLYAEVPTHVAADVELFDVFELFEYLKEHNTGTFHEILLCQNLLDGVAAVDQECAELLEKLICKDLSLGVDSKTVNKEIPNLINRFDCMLAKKYFDAPEKISGKEFAVTTKLDGFRLIAIKDEHGNVKFYSRVGQPVEGLIEIEAEFANLPDNVAFDGELTISDYFKMSSKEAYKAASKIIRLKGDTPKTGLTYRVFDCMSAVEFMSQKCNKTYSERRELLDTFADRVDLKHIDVLPVLYRGTDTSKIAEWLNKITAEDGEGCMLNLTDSPYVWGRTWNLQKCKKFQSLDLEVVGVEEGSGRLTGTLGAIHVRYKGGNIVKVGSGFSDDERKLYFEHPELILNKIVEIKYFESSCNADGLESLRFPTWVSNIRDPKDKDTPDF